MPSKSNPPSRERQSRVDNNQRVSVSWKMADRRLSELEKKKEEEKRKEEKRKEEKMREEKRKEEKRKEEKRLEEKMREEKRKEEKRKEEKRLEEKMREEKRLEEKRLEEKRLEEEKKKDDKEKNDGDGEVKEKEAEKQEGGKEKKMNEDKDKMRKENTRKEDGEKKKKKEEEEDEKTKEGEEEKNGTQEKNNGDDDKEVEEEKQGSESAKNVVVLDDDIFGEKEGPELDDIPLELQNIAAPDGMSEPVNAVDPMDFDINLAGMDGHPIPSWLSDDVAFSLSTQRSGTGRSKEELGEMDEEIAALVYREPQAGEIMTLHPSRFDPLNNRVCNYREMLDLESTEFKNLRLKMANVWDPSTMATFVYSRNADGTIKRNTKGEFLFCVPDGQHRTQCQVSLSFISYLQTFLCSIGTFEMFYIDSNNLFLSTGDEVETKRVPVHEG